MNARSHFPRRRRGFALVLTVALLGLLVLIVLGLSALTRTQLQLTGTAAAQTRARQNALAGLALALGELQKQAGDDASITAMAGIAGVPAGSAGGQCRHWCGVWDGAGNFRTWLVSGHTGSSFPAVQPGLTRIELVGNGSVGAEATNSEHVVVGRVAVASDWDATRAPGIAGGCAWWIGDEGVKLSAVSPPDALVSAGIAPVLGVTPSAMLSLRNALQSYPARAAATLSYEQLRLLPAPGTSLTPSTLGDNFQQVTLTHLRVVPRGTGFALAAGLVNLNTTSQPVWAALATTYNTYAHTTAIASPGTFGNRMRDNLPTVTGNGKNFRGPFVSAAAFQDSGLLTTALAGQGPTPTDFLAVMAPLLTTRSDTFRLRAYGDSLNAIDPTQVEAMATCEAIVQRTPQTMPGPFGRRFTVTFFRWLGPADL